MFFIVMADDYIVSDEYTNERKMFKGQVDVLEIFELDDRGDLVFDNDEKPIVSGERESKPIAEFDNCSNLIRQDIYNGYQDVYAIDRGHRWTWLSMRNQNLDFEGGTWFSIVGTAFGIYGIRSALKNTLLKKRGIGRTLIAEIQKYARKHGCNQLICVWPLITIIPLLEKLGFAYREEACELTKKFCGGRGHYILNI